MFDFACIVIALLIAYKNTNKNRQICFILLAWFVVSESAHTNLLLEVRAEHNWLIYQMYNIINVLTGYALIQSNSHVVMVLLMSVNILLNVITSLYFAYDFMPDIVYNVYYPIAVLISLTVLIYMFILTQKRGRCGGSHNHKTDFHWIFRMRCNDIKSVYSGYDV